MPNMEFGRRLAVERELEKTSAFGLSNACEWRGCVCMGWGGGGVLAVERERSTFICG